MPENNSEIEIGSVRPSELDTMLALLCAAFELPFEAARGIFYTDPYFDLSTKRVLRVGGEIASCLTIVPTTVWIRDVQVPVAGIAGIATRPEMRRRGYAAHLLNATLNSLRQMSFGLAALMPFDPKYYARLGWTPITEGQLFRFPASELWRDPEASRVVQASSQDIPHLQRLYDADSQGRTFHTLRDVKRWEYLLRFLPKIFHYTPLNGIPSGYVIYSTQTPNPEQWKSLHGGDALPVEIAITELVGQDENTRRALISHCAGVVKGGTVSYTGSPSQVSKLYPLFASFPGKSAVSRSIETVPGLMGRIIDFATLFFSLCSGWEGDTQPLLLEVVNASDRNAKIQRFQVTGNGKAAPRVIAADEIEASGDAAALLPKLSADAQTWAQIAVGLCSAAEAEDEGRLKFSSLLAREWGTKLFSQSTSFLPPPDAF